jgi:UDP-N-acetylglucosamine:LPS N-acetylglucosamine transferase
LDQLAQRASQLGRPDAAAHIVDEIAQLIA